jgi:hypothetical protein
LLFALPRTAAAAIPFIVGGIASVGFIAGFSIYRSVAPVDMADALNFFSACWSCQLFSDIMRSMSELLPGVYHAIGEITIPLCVALTAIWFAWNLLSGYIGAKTDRKWATEPWGIASDFGTHLIKLGFVIALLAAPLPRLINNVFIEPVFNVGLSLNRVVAGDDKFNECVVATAVADPVSVDARAGARGAYSPKLRHNLTCEIASVHQMTGLGMTAGWTMLNMAFSADYMHTILWVIPFFPNIPILFVGLLILRLFFYALLPIPLYLLEIFIKLSMDLIMLPLMLLSWLFKGWKIAEFGENNISKIINDVISGTVGVRLIGVFVSFGIIFMNAVFGGSGGINLLADALSKNDATVLMDGLMMKNDGLISTLLMGLFLRMFMTMIPQLVKTLFKIDMSKYKYYDDTRKGVKAVRDNIVKWYKGVRKSFEK